MNGRPAWRRPEGWLGLAVGLSLLAALGGLLLAPLNHDEHPYVASAILMAQGTLYADFGYNHGPYLPAAFRAAWSLAPDLGALLAARGFTFLWLAGMALATYRMTKDLAGSRAAGLLSAWVLLTSGLLVGSETVPVKDFAGAAVAFAGLALAIDARTTGRPTRWRLALAGALGGAAVGFKLSYGALMAPALVALAFRRSDGSAGRGLAAYGWGAALGLAPLAALAWRYGEVFWFCNVGYHGYYTEGVRLWGVGGAERLDLPAKLAYAAAVALGNPSAVALAIGGAIVLGAAAAAQQRVEPPVPLGWETAAGLAMVVAALSIALSPTPTWPHHLSVLVPAALGLIAAAIGQVPEAARGRALFVLLVIALVSSGAQAPRAALAFAGLANPAGWTSTRVRQAGLALRTHLPAPGPEVRVATLGPIFAIEGGYAIYPELATGPFFYFAGDLVPRSAAARALFTTPGTVGGLLADRPPAGILTGVERHMGLGEDLEFPLEAFATAHGYRLVALPGTPLRLFVRPR